MKTVRQLADEIGCTKQAIHQKMKKPPLSTDLQPFISKLENIVYIDGQGEALIKQAFPSYVVKSIDAVDVNTSSNNDLQLADILREQLAVKDRQMDDMRQDLRQQLDVKDNQLAARDEQIEKLTAALEHTTASLHAAQALHAGTMHKQLADGSLVEAPASEVPVDAESDIQQKKPFWKRLFNRDKL